MAIWAIADLHLSFGIPDKGMEIFGENWRNHPSKVKKAWKEKISPDDLVLIPGDISWALKLEEAVPDLEWIDKLPGTKVMLRGNHDFWWQSLKKMAEVMPPSIHIIQNNAFSWNDASIGGSRLWDSWEYSFNKLIPIMENKATGVLEKESDPQERDKIFERELQRLEISLKAMDKKAAKRIVMTHYPPIGNELVSSRVSDLLEHYKVDTCVFGHIHNVVHDFDPLFGTKNGVRYILTAADYLNFEPILVCE